MNSQVRVPVSFPLQRIVFSAMRIFFALALTDGSDFFFIVWKSVIFMCFFSFLAAAKKMDQIPTFKNNV